MKSYALAAAVILTASALLAQTSAKAADQAAVLSHLHRTEDSKMDELVAKGWLGIHQLIMRMLTQITKLAANKFQ